MQVKIVWHCVALHCIASNSSQSAERKAQDLVRLHHLLDEENTNNEVKEFTAYLSTLESG